VTSPTAAGVRPLPTRERQRLDTRELIFEAARSELRSHGIAGVSVSRIARAAGVSRQTVYDHFATVDDVLVEALRRYRQRVEELLDGRPLAGVPLGDLLHDVVGALFGALEPEGSRLRPAIASLLASGVDAGEWLRQPLFVVVAGAVRAARDAGDLAAGVDPDETARLLLLAVSGFLLVEADTTDRRAARAHRAVDVLLRGLR
jgi:TetR/AcrR family transcriptional regulator of autoinduction and epiphytic fitness